MRNALIVLLAVAAAIVLVGAMNYSLEFDIDYVVASWTRVSALWIAVGLAVILLVTGVVAAWLARAGVTRSCRKLEVELEATYRRLRDAEAKAQRVPSGSGEVGPSAAERDTQVSQAADDARLNESASASSDA